MVKHGRLLAARDAFSLFAHWAQTGALLRVESTTPDFVVGCEGRLALDGATLRLVDRNGRPCARITVRSDCDFAMGDLTEQFAMAGTYSQALIIDFPGPLEYYVVLYVPYATT